MCVFNNKTIKKQKAKKKKNIYVYIACMHTSYFNIILMTTGSVCVERCCLRRNCMTVFANYLAVLLNSCHGAKTLPVTSRSVFTTQFLLALSGRSRRKRQSHRADFFLLYFHVASSRCRGRTRRHCAPSHRLRVPERLAEGDAHSAVLPQRHCYKNIPPRVYRSSRTREPGPRGRRC